MCTYATWLLIGGFVLEFVAVALVLVVAAGRSRELRKALRRRSGSVAVAESDDVSDAEGHVKSPDAATIEERVEREARVDAAFDRIAAVVGDLDGMRRDLNRRIADAKGEVRSLIAAETRDSQERERATNQVALWAAGFLLLGLVLQVTAALCG